MKPSKTVDLSVMWANGKKLPEKIPFSECLATNFFQHPGRVSGFYGFHGRGKGLQYCAFKADELGLKFLPITLSVKLEKEISARMITFKTLPDVDMFNVARASREVIDFMADFWYSRLQDKGWPDSDLAKVNWRLTEKFMHEDESLVTDLLALPEFSHLRLFVYPAMPQSNPGVITAPISLGVTKQEFIETAVSPMYPDMEVVF